MRHKVIFCSQDYKIKKKFNFLKISKISNLDFLSHKKPCLVILDNNYLNQYLKNNVFNKKDYLDKVFIFYARNANDKKIKRLLREYDFFDYFKDKAGKEEILDKISKGFKLLKLKKENLNLRNNLETLVIVDPDTNFYKAKYFLEVIPQEIERAKKLFYPISFIMFDIDFFRQLNESYPYQFADLIIKELSKIIASGVPKESILVRWKEDSFIITLPHIGRKESYRIAKKIKDKVNLKRFSFRKVCKTRITLSGGLVSYPTEGISNYHEIIVSLEEALGFSKKEGGNRITFYSRGIRENIKDIDSEKDVLTLKKKVRYLNRIVNQELIDMIYGFAKTIEARDLSTARHVENTALLAKKIAKRLNLPNQEIDDVYHAAILHDLGKVGVDEKILYKKGVLEKAEREIVQAHPWIGTEILREIHALRGTIPAILYHHEKWDGRGYPFGLKGEEIPITARIIAVADVYEALVSRRPYRKAYSKNKAIEIIKRERGKSFDPKIVDIFLKLIKKI